jgi:hypothetical protein
LPDFSILLLPEGSTVLFIANRQLSALITPRMEAMDNFSTYFDPFLEPNQWKLLFKSNLPSSEKVSK